MPVRFSVELKKNLLLPPGSTYKNVSGFDTVNENYIESVIYMELETVQPLVKHAYRH